MVAAHVAGVKLLTVRPEERSPHGVAGSGP